MTCFNNFPQSVPMPQLQFCHNHLIPSSLNTLQTHPPIHQVIWFIVHLQPNCRHHNHLHKYFFSKKIKSGFSICFKYFFPLVEKLISHWNFDNCKHLWYPQIDPDIEHYRWPRNFSSRIREWVFEWIYFSLHPRINWSGMNECILIFLDIKKIQIFFYAIQWYLNSKHNVDEGLGVLHDCMLSAGPVSWQKGEN